MRGELPSRRLLVRMVTPPPIQRACAPCMASKGAKAVIACSLVPLPRNDIIFVSRIECTQSRPLEKEEGREMEGIGDEELTHPTSHPELVQTLLASEGCYIVLAVYPNHIFNIGISPFPSPSEKRRAGRRKAGCGDGDGIPESWFPFSLSLEARTTGYDPTYRAYLLERVGSGV
jgi:hypothetical protein